MRDAKEEVDEAMNNNRVLFPTHQSCLEVAYYIDHGYFIQGLEGEKLRF